jgi:hypothetical protein
MTRPATGQAREEVAVRFPFNGRSLFAFLFVTSRREHYLTQYVLREHARGRALADILEDPYVRNRSTVAERARLLERPEVVATIGERILADLRLALAEPFSVASSREESR